MMLRAFLLLVLGALLPVAACKGEVPNQKPASPSPTTPATSTTPSALAATRTIYEGYTAAPESFARLPHLSKFYLEDNQRKDAACQAGGGQGCAGDRFACLPKIAKAPGRVVDATLTGEAPGVSASVRLTLKFDETVVVGVDVVWEGGAWKIDQVSCSKPD